MTASRPSEFCLEMSKVLLMDFLFSFPTQFLQSPVTATPWTDGQCRRDDSVPNYSFFYVFLVRFHQRKRLQQCLQFDSAGLCCVLIIVSGGRSSLAVATVGLVVYRAKSDAEGDASCCSLTVLLLKRAEVINTFEPLLSAAVNALDRVFWLTLKINAITNIHKIIQSKLQS